MYLKGALEGFYFINVIRVCNRKHNHIFFWRIIVIKLLSCVFEKKKIRYSFFQYVFKYYENTHKLSWARMYIKYRVIQFHLVFKKNNDSNTLSYLRFTVPVICFVIITNQKTTEKSVICSMLKNKYRKRPCLWRHNYTWKFNQVTIYRSTLFMIAV